jgi:hypothetical protein
MEFIMKVKSGNWQGETFEVMGEFWARLSVAIDEERTLEFPYPIPYNELDDIIAVLQGLKDAKETTTA